MKPSNSDLPQWRARHRLSWILRSGYLVGGLLLMIGLNPQLLTMFDSTSVHPDSSISAIEDQYGILVNASEPERYYEGIPQQDRQGLTMEAPEGQYVARALSGLERALSRYPQSLIQDYLERVHVVGRLAVRGSSASGTFSLSAGAIYLVANRATHERGATYHAETVHHELSSLLVFEGGFPFADWASVNPTDFQYQTDIYDHGKIPDSPTGSGKTDLHQRGFISAHGTTRIDDDVNTYAELLFEHPGRMKSLMADYPRVAEKAELLMEFYMHLAPSMQEFFSKHYPSIEAERE